MLFRSKLFLSLTNEKITKIQNFKIQAVKAESMEQISRLRKKFEQTELKNILTDKQVRQKIVEISQQIDQLRYENCFRAVQTQFSDNFMVKGPFVKYIGQDGNWCQLFLEKTEHFKQAFFSVRISHSERNRIRIGIADLDSRKQYRNSLNNKDVYCIEGSQGRLYGVQGQKFEPFGPGQIINVRYRNDRISFKNKVQYVGETYYFQNVDDLKKNFVPYIQMFDTGDLVQFIFW